MVWSVQHVILDDAHGDHEGRLVLRDGRLVAVISQLGALHGNLEGQWYVEKSFGERDMLSHVVFDSPDAFCARAEKFLL